MGTNTGIGIGIGIPFKNFSSGGRQPLPLDLKASLKGVWIAYGKSNNDADRSIVKNLVDLDNPFIISNAAFKLNSGFGKYEVDFTSWIQTNGVIASSDKVQNSIIGRFLYFNTVNKKEDVPSFKVNITLGQQGKLQYNYIKEDGTSTYIVYSEAGIYTIPASYFSKYTGGNAWFGFYQIEGTSIIEQIPSLEGAFVTDGVDDLITSTKTVQEMLGGSNELTIVSMVHQVKDSANNVSFTNYIRGSANGYFRNIVNNYDKTGIYGYTSSDLKGLSVVNNILGDKNDYTSNGDNRDSIINGNFSVQGYSYNDGNNTGDFSSVAWYWTIIANKVLTTDQINQVIAYYNLDKWVTPDILYDVKKQGITNENHAEFNDKLIDYSGNGRDIQLNNIAWKGDSGIGKYETDFTKWLLDQVVDITRKYSSFNIKTKNDSRVNSWVVRAQDTVIPSMKVKVTGISSSVESLIYRYSVIDDKDYYIDITSDGIYELPQTNGKGWEGFRIVGKNFNISVEQIPSHAGALCLDGVNDFGKVTGMPIYKDYTVIADYERFYLEPITGGRASILSKSSKVGDGSFIFNLENQDGGKACYTFGEANGNISDDITRIIRYQSKYYNTKTLSIGTAEDNDFMVLGKVREVDSRYFCGAIYSLMSFPYSMSEFLIERQLKKHKLGTLYPDMVEFRPVIKANANYKITYYQIDSTNTWKSIKVGDYIVVGAKLAFQITFDNDASELKEVVSPQLSGIIVEKRPPNPGYNIYSYITSKSPQKINITIDEYIRFEDIVQPYPSLFTLIDYDTEEVYSWGSKLKVGARFKGNVVNLLPNMYEWQGNVLYNGEVLNWGINPGVVAKEMVFSWNMPFKYLIDNNEPKCILSPRLLRIPNSSYKILGYIPDISGHGNNGVINNSAYAEGSGVNEDGSYQFDGVDDFVTIPTTVGGKQVLMKVNWDSPNASILYDQRGYNNEFAIYNGMNDNYNNPIPAYQERNNGQTYIDGILNKNIKANELMAITHNITITNELSLGTNKTYPIIGSSKSNSYFVNMALYDFMLFDDISTDDKILELNEYVGIEAKVELPSYYWDAYGKTNLDADKATIQQRGVAVGDYDLTNTNFAYDKMSGFGGYEFEKFTDTTKWIETKREDGIEVIEKNDYSFTAKKVGTGQYFWDFKNNRIKTLDRDLTVKAISNNNVYIRWEFKYRTAKKPDIDSAIILLIQAMTPNVPITVTLPYKTQEEQTELGVVEGSAYYLFYFDPSDIPVGDEYTVEMLPLYTNGLVYDGITDYSKNANIPALDDFTAIMKRKWLKNQGCPLIKGSKVYEGGNGNALLFEWDKAYNFVFYKRTDIMEGEVPDNISFITPTNYNGNVITRGSGQDTNGICIAGDGNAGFANIVFYKLILYPKTIPLLQINFLKNLMEKDEIIDLNNPIFIKNE